MSTVTDALPISKKDLLNLMNAFIPKGMIAWFALDEAPEGWEVYEPLLGKYPLGAYTSIGTEVAAGLPNITGSMCIQYVSYQTGAFYPGGAGPSGGYYNDAGGSMIHQHFDASRCSSIYGSSSTVTPASVKLLPCIKL